MTLADETLDEHGHQLFLDPIRRRFQIVACVLKEGRRVDHLDRLEELRQPDIERGVVVGQHVRVVDAGKRLKLGVFQQARRANDDRFVAHPLEQIFEASLDFPGKLS